MEADFAEEPTRLESVELARQVVEIASDKQARDIVMLDLRRVSLIADYFVICSGTSERQITAIQTDVVDELRNSAHRRPLRQEGNAASGWVLLDYGDVVVHVFAPSEREYYRLEDVWSEALPVVRLQ